MKRVLYVTDLDGTLLDDNACLTDFAREELNALLNQNLHFTVATARSIDSVKRILGNINLQLPVILFNGAYVIDYHTEEILYTAHIDHESVEFLENWMKEQNYYPFFSCLENKKQRLLYRQIESGGMQWYLDEMIGVGDKRLGQIQSVDDLMDSKRMSYTFMDRKEKIQQILAFLEPKMKGKVNFQFFENEYSKGWYWLTIQSIHATKANGIKKMLEISGEEYDKLVVFGDHFNDKEMFLLADEAYAVENAEEELKRLAFGIIPSNTNHGVIHFMKENYLQNK